MQQELVSGLVFELSREVTPALTARAVASGAVEVLATPMLIAMMEEASLNAVLPCLPAGSATVGTVVNMKHTAATPVGGTVRVTATLTEVDGRRLLFHVEAFDAAGQVGEAEHERFIVDEAKFMARAEKRK